MPAIPFLDLKAQYQSIKPEVDRAIQEVIDSSTFALGPAVERFEREFAAYCGVEHCVGVNSGTAALKLLLCAYGIGPGDEVITVANSFFATAEAIVLVGATPVLVDCSEADALIEMRQVEQATTPRTKAIIPVHLYGQCAEMDPLMELAKARHLAVIEDACQAHGSTYKGRRAGSLGHAAAFSFYPGKNLGAFGEAGVVTTNDAAIAATIRMLRDHGMPHKYHHRLIGENERMDGIQGAVLSVKLGHLDAWNAARRTHAEQYRNALSSIAGVTLFTAHPDREHNEHLFAIRVAKRDAVQQNLAERGVATGIHYPIPIHQQEAFQGHGWNTGPFPIAEKLSEEILSLPMFAEMTEVQREEVCNALRAARQP